MTPSPKLRRTKIIISRRAQLLSLVLVAVIFLYFLFDKIIMPVYTRQGSERAVPSLVGLSYEQAVKRADSSGFKIIQEPPKLGLNAPEGSVLEQHPFAGSLAKPGRKIRVIPATRATQDQIPELVGLEQRDAQLRSKNLGLVCTDADVKFRYSERVRKGYVISQDPRPGKKLEVGQTVKLVVSLGPEPQEVTMPALIEMPLSQAREMLQENGLKLGRVTRKQTGLYPSGIVIAQSVRSGEPVKPGAKVDLVVAVPAESD